MRHPVQDFKFVILRKTLTLSAILAVLCGSPCFAAERVKAPELSGADSWLNTDGDKPVSLAALKGRVVLLDFWTYCCINCMHIMPDLHYLEQKHANDPFVVIGVHSGKFDEEKDADHIRQAILRHNITHPVAIDSQYKIWNAYGVPGWPTLILIDPEGYAVAGWSGEGHRDEIDAKITELLKIGREKGELAEPVHYRTERASFKSGTLEFPGKVLADAPGGRLFISDTNHNRVLVTDLNGKIQHIIGSGAVGLKDGGFSQAQLHQPQGLALSSDGNVLYIADTENHSLRAADLKRETITTIAGTGSQAHRFPQNSPARTTALSSPWDLARIDNKLYIAMAGLHQIWVMDLKSQSISVFAGTSREGAVDGKATDAWFAQPSGLTSDGKHLYVADSEDSSIRSISLPTGDTTTLAGAGELFGFGHQDGTGKAARFQHPLGVAIDGSTLYVADTFNGLIRKIDVKSGAVTTWLGSGASDLGTDAAPNFYEPGGLSIGGNTMYVADTNHHRIVAVDLGSKKATALDIQEVAAAR